MAWRYSHSGTVALLTLVILTCRGSILTGPTDTVYENGKQNTGYVHCEVDPNVPDITVFWFIQTDSLNSIIYSSPNWIIRNSAKKYDISSDSSVTGNFTLVINSLERSDSGTYRCQVGSDVGSATITVAGE